MPFVQRVIEPKYLSKTSLWDADGKPLVTDDELEAVTNNTLSNALRQLASLVLVADDIFTELNKQLQQVTERSEKLKVKIEIVEVKVQSFDPKKVTVPESDLSSFALFKDHYAAPHNFSTKLFGATTRPHAVQELYEAAAKTPVHLMRQMDRWRRDGHRSSRFFLCTPVLGSKRRKIRTKIDIDIETRMPAAVEELRRWTSSEALGDVTVAPDCPNRIAPNVTCLTDGDLTDGTIASDDEAIDHKLPSPEEQLQVVALKFPAEIVKVDITGRSFDRMSVQRRSLLHGDVTNNVDTDGSTLRRRTKSRRPRNRRRNTLAGTDQKEIQDALTAGEEALSCSAPIESTVSPNISMSNRSRSSDILRATFKKESPEQKKSHFSTLKQWGKNRLRMMKSNENKYFDTKPMDVEDINIYETVSIRGRSLDREKQLYNEKKSEKTNSNMTALQSAMNIAVKLRESSAQRRLRRNGENKDEPHSSSGNWSASSESGRASIGSESTNHPKSSTSAATSSNSLSLHAPSSVNSRRRFNINTSTSGSVTSEGTLTPDIIHDLHEDGETSSVYSCDTEGYYTSFHMDSGLKTLKEEDAPVTPLHSTSTFSNSPNITVLSAENEYELFGKGSTSTTTSSAGTVCTMLLAADSSRSLVIGPAVPERKSSLSKLSTKDKSPESSLERDYSSDKTGTVKRSPASTKATVVAVVHKQVDGDISPDSGHNTSSSPIESISSPNGQRSGSEFEFSESSDMEGPDRIERIRVKTVINVSRIPSMCVITPPHSDDESVESHKHDNKIDHKNRDNKNNKLKCIETNLDSINLDSKTTNDFIKIGSSNNPAEKDLDILKFTDNNNTSSNKMQIINVNPQTGYATIETVDEEKIENNDKDGKIVNSHAMPNNKDVKSISQTMRAPSPSGGSMTIKNQQVKPLQNQPIFKATLMPLNNMIGKLKTNFSNFANRRDSKSPNKNPVDDATNDSGEYVTIADVRNNNEKAYANTNDIINRNLNTVLSGKVREMEYISLNELPCNDQKSPTNSTVDSLERNKRQGARVTLNAEGKVVYSSDSLKRTKNAHTTFEPGPFVKAPSSPTQSPLPNHRTPKTVRPVTSQDQSRCSKMDNSRPLSPQLGKVVIRASSGMMNATSEVIRMPPSKIVTPSMTPMSPKVVNNNARGAYVHMQETRTSLSPTREEERAISPSNHQPIYKNLSPIKNMGPGQDHGYQNPPLKTNTPHGFGTNYVLQRDSPRYSTLPSRKTQITDLYPERSVTPDITRGLINRQFASNTLDRDRIMRSYTDYPQTPNTYNSQFYGQNNVHRIDPNLGIPVQMPQIPIMPKQVPSTQLYYQNNDMFVSPNIIDHRQMYRQMPNVSSPVGLSKLQDTSTNDSLKISPIDPRNSGSFHSSTPSKQTDLKAAVNLENKLMSPKKSTMSNEELYAVIHKCKKKMNINADEIDRGSPSPSTNSMTPGSSENSLNRVSVKSPETGYIGDKARSRLSWSPGNGEYVDFNTNIDNSPPSTESRSRQSWACSDRKGVQQTSRLDFKRLLLQHGKGSLGSAPSKKISAVEQLKLSKQQIQAPKQCNSSQNDLNILDLSSSPRTFGNRKFGNTNPSSPKNSADKNRTAPKLLSPRSQWRFTNPRSDVLSSTILEDCHEDESPNNSGEKNISPKPNQRNETQTCVAGSNTAGGNVMQHSIRRQIFSGEIPKVEADKPHMTIAQRLQVQRAQFFNSTPQSGGNSVSKKFQTLGSRVSENEKNTSPPTLETAF